MIFFQWVFMICRKFSLLCAFLAFPLSALACEPPVITTVPFVPDPAAANSARISEFVARNAPLIGQISIYRGTPAEESLCGGQAAIAIEMSLPGGTSIRFSDLGIAVRVINGTLPDRALPHRPVRPYPGDESTFTLGGYWFEGPPSKHKTLDALISIHFIAPDGTTGPPSTVTLFSEAKITAKDEQITR